MEYFPKLFANQQNRLKYLFLIALIVRLFLFLGAFYLSNFNIEKVITFSDTNDYILLAKKILSNQSGVSNGFAERVFPGWPLLFIPLSFITGFPWAAVIVGILFSSAVPVFFYKIIKDWNASLILAFFTPTFLVHSINGMSEPAYLLFVLLGIFFAIDKKIVLSGLIIGFCAWIRPTALFPCIGIFLFLILNKEYFKSIAFVLMCGLMLIFFLLFNNYYFNDPLQQFHSYSSLPNVSKETLALLGTTNGSHFGLPFVNIIKATILLNPPIWKIILIWSHVLIALFSVFWGFYKKQYLNSLGLIFLTWAFFNTIFILSTGEYWALFSFDRYFVWALPAYVFLLKDFLRLSKVKFYILCIFSISMAATGSWKHF